VNAARPFSFTYPRPGRRPIGRLTCRRCGQVFDAGAGQQEDRAWRHVMFCNWWKGRLAPEARAAAFAARGRTGS